MFYKMANLQCPDGHLHYSPIPKHWDGRKCDRSLGGSGARCKKTMQKIKPLEKGGRR